LYFDNHFWLEHLPKRYAQSRRVDVSAAKAELVRRYRAVQGTIDWYCVDYWSRELGVDIVSLKREVDHLIAVHRYVIEFLNAMRAIGKRVALVTNAHAKSLKLKLERTRLGGHFDSVVCAHDLGLPKEDVRFWERLRVLEPFDPARTLLVDDNVSVLRSAQAYRIAHLVGVRRPDTRLPSRSVEGFPAIESFADIVPDCSVLR
jgi:HAD superfamily hydrolase (TIGR01509 family)